MALKKNINQISDSLISNRLGILDTSTYLYLRIESYKAVCNTVEFMVEFYNEKEEVLNDEETKILVKSNLEPFVFTLEIDENLDKSTRKQGYEYLKTLPEFAGCEDC